MTTASRFHVVDHFTDTQPSVTRTTGIGSLPHHNVDTALEYSFKFGIPYLPQIPIRNPWEFMIPQALEGLPGLQVEPEGTATLNYDIWENETHRLERKLNDAFASGNFEAFEPSTALSSCWQPFLWELQERETKIAKIQICGPMTAQWALRLKDGSASDKNPKISTQIFQLILARALAMVTRLKSCEIQPILFLDEPGLYAFAPQNPKHVLCLQELKVVIQTLQKQGALVGIHCCSNTAWENVLRLGMDYLSIDSALSLKSALQKDAQKSAMAAYIESGGRLSLGIVPTGRSSALHAMEVSKLFQQLMITFSEQWSDYPELAKKALKTALVTPACGLALQSTSDAELILEKLVEVYEYFRN